MESWKDLIKLPKAEQDEFLKLLEDGERIPTACYLIGIVPREVKNLLRLGENPETKDVNTIDMTIRIRRAASKGRIKMLSKATPYKRAEWAHDYYEKFFDESDSTFDENESKSIAESFLKDEEE